MLGGRHQAPVIRGRQSILWACLPLVTEWLLYALNSSTSCSCNPTPASCQHHAQDA